MAGAHTPYTKLSPTCTFVTWDCLRYYLLSVLAISIHAMLSGCHSYPYTMCTCFHCSEHDDLFQAPYIMLRSSCYFFVKAR